MFGRNQCSDRSLQSSVKRFSRRLVRSYHKRKERALRWLSEAISGIWPTIKCRRHSVLFVGYSEADLGLGVTFRNMLSALDSSDLRFSIHPFNRNVETRFVGPFLESRYDLDGIYDINVIYVAPDQLPHVLSKLNKQVRSARYNILRTYWELPLAPVRWGKTLRQFDELWVPNRFVADAFRLIFDRPINIIPVCVNVERTTTHNRPHFRLEDDAFYFLFSFDYYSFTARKNPLGVVQAFIYAFPHLYTKVRLIIKARGPETLDVTTAQFLANISTFDKRIGYLNQSIARNEMLSLLSCCDCYISLHRSEGFGMGMAEAMALGKPVIGTDFSGSREFLNADTGFPVPCLVRPLIDGEYPDWQGQHWAEPDLTRAVDLMRFVVDNPSERERRGLRGQREIEARHSAATVVKVVNERLGDVRNARKLFRTCE